MKTMLWMLIYMNTCTRHFHQLKCFRNLSITLFFSLKSIAFSF